MIEKFGIKKEIIDNVVNNDKVGIVLGPSKTGKQTLVLNEIDKNKSTLIFCGVENEYDLTIKTNQLDLANKYFKRYANMVFVDTSKTMFKDNCNGEIKLIVDENSKTRLILLAFLVKYVEAKINNTNYIIIKNFFGIIDPHITSILLGVLADCKSSKVIILSKFPRILKLIPRDLKNRYYIAYVQPEKSMDTEDAHPDDFIPPEDRIESLFNSNNLKYTNNLLKMACAIMTRELAKKTQLYKNTNITNHTEDAIEAIIREFYATYSDQFFHYTNEFNADVIKKLIKQFSVVYQEETNLNTFLQTSSITQRVFYNFMSKELSNKPFYSRFFRILSARIFSEELLFKTAKKFDPNIKIVNVSYGIRIRTYKDAIAPHIKIDNDLWLDFVAKERIVSEIVHGENDWESLTSIKNSEVDMIEATLNKLAQTLNWSE